MSREEVKPDSKGLVGDIGDSKTLCGDIDACQALNHFLDTGYGVPPTLAFNIESTQKGVSVSIDFEGFGVREKSELIGRMVHFVMNELNKVKNGY